MTNASNAATADLCDECQKPMPPSDCYAIEWTEWVGGNVQRHVVHPYPGAFHNACIPKARKRLDAERARGRA